ncbi:MAG TPA: FliH/SctL family protein, partial [Rhodocyclaceae bacterium]|nr:FliH/SctL family protein [Rhodocyclaceae bacterium]
MSQVIPKNQASGAFQRWEPVNFDNPSAKPASKTKGPTESRIEIAPGVSLPTADDFERMQQEAYKEGYATGYEEGSARGRMEAAELHQLLQAMDQALSKFDQEVAEEIQALALEVARQVVRETLDAKPESILTVIREALLLVPQQNATVRVNPQDLELVRTYLG